MSRTLRYILAIILVAAVTLWLLTVYRSCERKKQLEDTTIIGATGAEEENDGTTEDLYVDEEDDTTDPDATADSDSEVSPYDGTTDIDAGDEDTPGSGADNESGGLFADGEADIAGEYLVVAGAFVLKENAERHIQDLKNKGFNAERRVFLGSDYHSVIIGNFETEAEASTVARQLGTEAYVHKKRYLKKR